MSIIPQYWMPNVRMKRIICHWTAGKYHPSSNDLNMTGSHWLAPP